MPLTTHPADDYSPIWSPDGKRICFVSTRDDPQGDLYIARINKRNKPHLTNIQRIISDPGRQGFPGFFQDGKYLVYQDGSTTEARIILFHLAKKIKAPLTAAGFLQPHISPRDDRILCIQVAEEDYGGYICIIHPGNLKNPTPEIETVYQGSFPAAAPCWSPDARSFCASLVNRDSNNDGLLTAEDGLALYRYDLVGELYVPRQISTGDASDSEPFWAADNQVYFVSDRSGNFNLMCLASEGPIPAAKSAEAGFKFAKSIGLEADLAGREFNRVEILNKLLAYERVRQDFPADRQIGALSMLESARLLQSSGAAEQAETFLKRLPRIYPDQNAIVAEASIDYQLQVHNARFLSDDRFYADNPVSLIDNLTSICDIYGDQRNVCARAWYLIGAGLEILGEIEGALKAYSKVVEQYADMDDYPAEALIRTAMIYATIGSGEEALRTYLEEIRRYAHRSEPTEKAISRVIAQQVTGDDPIAGLQDLISRYPDLPALGAAAQSKIADLLVSAGEIELALEEYQRLRSYAVRYPIPYIRGLLAEALIASAQLQHNRGEYLLAQTALEEVEQSLFDLKDGYYARKARLLRIKLLVERAEYLASNGDWELSLTNYQKALALDPEDVKLHRGKIAAAQALGRLEETIFEYRRSHLRNEDSPEILYSLGLCLSYAGARNLDLLEESNSLIQQAISIDPTLTYGYLTLSYNYEAIERFSRSRQESEKKSTGFISGIGRTLSQLGRVITLQRKAQSLQGYEQAIEILQLGLAINDEEVDPELESAMLLNLGNIYYQLGEFGYSRALRAYRERLIIDSTFASPQQEALIRERIGQAAAIQGENLLALDNYHRAQQLYHKKGMFEQELRVLLRIAELYQVENDAEQSNTYYTKAFVLKEKEGLEVSPSKWWENMAFNALNLGDDQQAIYCTQKALDALPEEDNIPFQSYYNPLILEVFGFPIPVWDFGYLGTGSPMSAIGLTERDELLLNHAIAQEVHFLRKDLDAAISEASKRLAIVIRRSGDPEAEAIIWSELGFLYWQKGESELAQRCFLRSLDLCSQTGLTSGRLSALINLGALAIQDPAVNYSADKIYQDEIAWFSEYDIGLKSNEWREILKVLTENEKEDNPVKIRDLIRRTFSSFPDPYEEAESSIDWELLTRLLILKGRSHLTLSELKYIYSQEIARFEKDPLGFGRERIRFFNLYAQICLRSAQGMGDTMLTQQFKKMELEGEALWAFQRGIIEGRNRGYPELEALLLLELSDYLYFLRDYSGCSAELSAAKELAWQSGENELLWRVFWRYGRVMMEPEIEEILKLNNNGSEILSKSASDWFDLAIGTWNDLPAEIGDLGAQMQRKTEARVMAELAAQLAFQKGELQRSFNYVQNLVNIPLIEAARSRSLPLQYEQRKFIWGMSGGSIPYLRRELQNATKEIARVAHSAKADSTALDSLNRRREAIRDEYEEILKNVSRDDPEFAALFSLQVIPNEELQKLLQSEDLMIQVVEINSKVICYIMNQDSLSAQESLEFTDADDLETFYSFYERYIEQLIERNILNSEVKRIFIILPDSWRQIPVEKLIIGSETDNPSVVVYRLPDAQSLFFLDSKQSLGRGKNLSFSQNGDIPNFQPAILKDSDSWRGEIERAGMVYIEPDCGKIAHPLERILYQKGDTVIRTSDLFGISTGADALILRGDFPEEAFLVKAGFFAGFSSVIILPEGFTDAESSHFLSEFASLKKELSPGIAFYQTCRKINNDLFCLNGFRYYGNGGLNWTERRDFAQKMFASTVLKGNYNLERGDGVWALRYYDRALEMAEETRDSAAMENLHRLRIKAARISGDWKEAVRSQIVLNETAEQRGDLSAVESGLRNLSYYYHKQGDLGEAITATRRARDNAWKRGAEIRAAEDDQILSSLYAESGDNLQAEKASKLARGIFLEWEDYKNYITSSIYLSRLYINEENYYEAARLLEDLGRHVEKIRSTIDPSVTLKADYYQHSGVAYEGLTDYPSALEAHKKALEAIEDTTSAAAAFTYEYMAGIYWKMGNYQVSLDYNRRAKALFANLGLKEYVYLAQNTEALIYLNLGDPDRALEYAKTALEGAINAGDVKSRSQIEKNLGLIELARGFPEKARTRFLQALVMDRESGSLKGEAYANLDLGNAYLQMGKVDSAEAALSRTLEMGNTLSEVRLQARSLLGLGHVQILKKLHDRARNYLLQAEEIASKASLDELIWRIDLALAQAEEANRKYEDAQSYLESAMSKVEAMRSSIVSEGLKNGFMEDKREIYALAAKIYMSQEKYEAAFEVAERARARTFLDLLQSRPMDQTFGVDRELERRKSAVLERLSKLHSRSEWLISKGQERDPEENTLLINVTAQIDSMETIYRHILDEIESSHPGYRDLTTVSPASPGDIKEILKDDEILVEYFPVSDGTMIFCVTYTGIYAKIVPISEDSLKKATANLRLKLEKRLSVDAESRRFDQWLIEPIEERLSGYNTLIIAPAGPLHYLPFSLLQDKKGEYLLDRFQLAFSPSASIFTFCRESSKRKSLSTEYPFLAFGNPSTNLPQESLFFAEKEVESVAFTFTNTESKLGIAAAENELYRRDDNTGALHLACHGVYDADNPLFSCLFLAPDSSDDGRLEMHEIFRLRLDHCSLVTLSACESGLGKIAGGEEVIGLNRAFIYAGTPRIVSTLWKVDDLATAVLIKHFYRNLKNSQTPAEALQRAQMHVRDRIHQHPAYWAAFQLMGEPGGTFRLSEPLN